MKKAKDFTGAKIGRLYVLERAPDKVGCYGQPIIQWICVCECGDSVIRRSCHLYRGNCSCKKCKAIEDAKKFGYGEIRQHHWYTIQRQAQKRGLEFSISIESAWLLFEKQEAKCALSGIPLVFAKTKVDHAKGKTTASLDRIDSTKGYVEGNVQWLHKWVNVMKWDFSQDEFIDMCRTIVEYHEKVATTSEDPRREVLPL